jgi:hypothetical protein
MAESSAAPGESTLGMDPATVNYFQSHVMGRTPAQIAADKTAAKEFFFDRFGLDFRSTQADAMGQEMIPGAMFTGFYQSPQVNYRAYTISGESVPASGWEVRDGGWAVMLTQETVVHGAFGGPDGKTLPAGAMLVYGNYNIRVEKPGNQSSRRPHPQPEPIVMHYQSFTPIVADANGNIGFICDLFHPVWGVGRARGVVQGGSIRSVLSFPPGRS